MQRILYIPFDHLHREYGVLRDSDPERDLVLLVESERMLRASHWHHQRLYFMVSAARHFVEELRLRGYQVTYERAATTLDGIAAMRDRHPGMDVWCAEPSSHVMMEQLADAGVQFVDNDFFLTKRADFRAWAGSQKQLLMENFYRLQRKRLNALMEGAEPLGGRWNFDAENRLGPPKQYTYPPYLTHERDAIDEQVLTDLAAMRLNLWGAPPDGTWGTTRAAALRQLDHFLEYNFGTFGPYEDAMPAENWAVHHSLLSPYLNVGLLHAEEVLQAVLRRFERGDIAIESCEGFVRQLIGWREYVNGLYWHFGAEYKQHNELAAGRPLLPLFDDPTATKMNCVSSIVQDLHDRSWVHHIPRLMVLSNLALIAGVNPQEFLQWMRERFIDASDWVMVPNVIGMGVHADGGRMMTKPYAAGGAYISRMGNYCKSCVYDPKKRTGEDACPFTTLYWDFLDRNRDDFARNHRIAQQVRGLARLSDLDAVRDRARVVLRALDEGSI